MTVILWPVCLAAVVAAAPDLPTTLTQLTHANPRMRAAAFENLRHVLPTTEALPHLTLGLQDPDHRVRTEVLKLIGRTEAALAVPWLTYALGDSVPSVCVQAVAVLSDYRDTACLPALTLALRHRLPKIRYMAIRALGMIRSPQVLTILVNELGYQEEKVLRSIPLALALYPDDDQVNLALQRALTHPDPRVRIRVALVLFDRGLETRTAAREVLKILKDPDAVLRKEAAEALGQLLEPGAIPALRAALEDRDAAVKAAAWQALDYLGELEPAPLQKRR